MNWYWWRWLWWWWWWRQGGKQELLPEGVGSFLRLLLKQGSGIEATIKDPSSVSIFYEVDISWARRIYLHFSFDHRPPSDFSFFPANALVSPTSFRVSLANHPLSPCLEIWIEPVVCGSLIDVNDVVSMKLILVNSSASIWLEQSVFASRIWR